MAQDPQPRDDIAREYRDAAEEVSRAGTHPVRELIERTIARHEAAGTVPVYARDVLAEMDTKEADAARPLMGALAAAFTRELQRSPLVDPDDADQEGVGLLAERLALTTWEVMLGRRHPYRGLFDSIDRDRAQKRAARRVPEIHPSHDTVAIDKATLDAACTRCGKLVMTGGLPGRFTAAGLEECSP